MKCKKCNKEINKTGNNQKYCDICVKIVKKENFDKYKKNPENLIKLKESRKKWRKNNPDKIRSVRQTTRNKLRLDVLNAYGHKCKCCGEERSEFLAIDHIFGDGNKHRKTLHPNASAQTFYTWLRKNNYPKEFQVLCHNCNSAKEYYKLCPHHRPFKILISPHSDDSVLFSSYTILREKPIVITVTHSTLQGDNGNERILEDYKAMKILGAPILFLGINEDKLTKEILIEKLLPFAINSEAWLPEEIDGGNPQHNLITSVLKKMFWKIHYYKTYTGLEDRTVGKEIIPTDEELELKKKAMACYTTQINNPNTSHYFNTTKEYE